MLDMATRLVADAGKSGRANKGKESLMARRRWQDGSLTIRGKRHKKWVGRWREDVLLPDGSLGRIRRTEVLALVRDVPTKKEAKELLEDRLRSINQGRIKPKSVLTFRAFALEKWEPAILPTLKRSTQRDYRSLLRRHLLPAFGDKRLRDIERAEVQLFLMGKGEKLATKTVHHLRVLLGRILGVAVEWGYLSENAAAGTKLPKNNQPVERAFLTVEQVQYLLAQLTGLARVLVQLAILTGLRRGELFGLRWKHLDFQRRVIHVRESLYEGKSGLPKTKSSIRDVPMSDPVFETLVELRDAARLANSEGFVFADEHGSPLNPQKLLDEMLYPACDQLKIPRAGWHTFRHTHATLLSDLGESIKTTQALLGHRDLDTTLSVYTHAVPESQRKAVARLADVLDPSWTQIGPNLAQRAS